MKFIVNTQLQLEHAKTNSASQTKTSCLRDVSTLSVLSYHKVLFNLETKDFEHSLSIQLQGPILKYHGN
jgi:hypothetical protein